MMPESLTTGHIAAAMRVSEASLAYLASTIGDHFDGPCIEYVRGKRREIYRPKYEIKQRLRWLHRALQRWGFDHPIVHGGVKGRSCVTAAELHVGDQHQATRDIKDCYPSIRHDQLLQALLRRGFSPEVAGILASLMTIDGQVPQGSPISSDAMNLYLYEADQKLASESGKYNVQVTRTYDDMVASGKSLASVARIACLMDEVINEHGLTVNPKKRMQNGFRRADEPRHVHGIDVSSKRGTRLSKKHADTALGDAHTFVRAARSAQPANLAAVAAKRAKATGWLHYAGQMKQGPTKKIKELVAAGDRIILERLARLGIIPHKKKWWVGAPMGRAREERRFKVLISRWEAALSPTRVAA